MPVRVHHWSAVAEAPLLLVWPDGCRDLILVVPPQGAPEVLATGLELRARDVTVVPGTTLLGCRFAPGVRFAWDDSPRHAHRDRELAADATLPREVRAWAQRVQRAPERGASLLAEATDRWARAADADVASMVASITAGVATPRSWQATGSARTRRRRLVDATGGTATFWRSLHRVRTAARLLAVERLPPAEVACRVGFADQAHLTRALRRWLDRTPDALRRDAGAVRAVLDAPDAFTLLASR
jgi:hypothetical protein